VNPDPAIRIVYNTILANIASASAAFDRAPLRRDLAVAGRARFTPTSGVG
jgi:hypothetical protein